MGGSREWSRQSRAWILFSDDTSKALGLCLDDLTDPVSQ